MKCFMKHTHIYEMFFNFSQANLEPYPLIGSTHELSLIIMVSALARSYHHYYYRCFFCYCYLNLKKISRAQK